MVKKYFFALSDKDDSILVAEVYKQPKAIQRIINPAFVFEAEESELNNDFVNKKIKEILDLMEEKENERHLESD